MTNTPDTALKIAEEMESYNDDPSAPGYNNIRLWANRLRALRTDLDPAGGEGAYGLLPCPFCGGEGKLDRCPVSGGWFAYCGGVCQIGYGHAWHPEKSKAIEYWNRRT